MTLRTLRRNLQQQRREGRSSETRQEDQLRPNAMVRAAPETNAVRVTEHRRPSMERVEEPIGYGVSMERVEAPSGDGGAAPALLLRPPCSGAGLAERLEAIRAEHPKLYASLARLDEAQLSAVLCDSPSAVVRAPVGSGKTHVLAHRVLFLHRVRAVPLRRMAVLTFTNRAAAEIRARIVALSDGGRPDPDHLWLVGTFHGVARALLSQALPIDRIGYGPDFTVLDDEGCERLLEDLISRHHLRIRGRRRLRARLRARECMALSRDDLPRLAALYADEKRAAHAMDFDDLIGYATQLLDLRDSKAFAMADRGTGDAPREDYAPSCVVVDELQDCEPRELDFLRSLRGRDASFFAVGDPHQAIYSWRGSLPEVFSRARTDLGRHEHVLRRNYRSTRTILECARTVLGPQPELGGELTSTRDLGKRIVLRRDHDPLSEALYLAERVAGLRVEGIPYGEMAILFRLRAQAEVIRAALVGRGIPCVEGDDLPADAVRLLTLHAAKGLEFRHVFLSGVNDGLVPLGRRRDPVDDAEERRLLFVGLTRAQDGVEISYHAQPHQAGATGEASRYLRGLPADLVDLQDGPPDRAPTPTVVDDGAPLAAETQQDPVSRFWPGQTVRHPRYGGGVVLRVGGDAVECDFGKRGSRSFPLALCPLLTGQNEKPPERLSVQG